MCAVLGCWLIGQKGDQTEVVVIEKKREDLFLTEEKCGIWGTQAKQTAGQINKFREQLNEGEKTPIKQLRGPGKWIHLKHLAQCRECP